MKDRHGPTLITTVVKEISADAAKASVKIDQDVFDEVTEGDENPHLVLVEIDEGKSGNNIWYDRAILESIAEQVNSKEPVGYLGHKHFQGQDKDDLLPDPQTLWMGAVVENASSGGKAVFKALGYVPPNAKVRDWLKRRLVNSVSWSGDGVLTPAKEGGYRLKEFVLESIDWSRKNKAGMKGQRLTVITEMEGLKGGNKAVDGEERSYEDIVSRLMLPDLKAHNPALILTIKEMTKEELKDETATAVAAKEEELNNKHAVELAAVPEIDLVKKIRNLLGIKEDADPVESLATIIQELDKAGRNAVQSWFDKELEKKVPNEKARRLIGRLIPVTEMEGDWRTEKGQEKIKEQLEERVDEALEKDEDIQAVITEMGSTRGGPRLVPSNRDNDDDKRDEKGERKLKETSNLSVERVRVS